MQKLIVFTQLTNELITSCGNNTSAAVAAACSEGVSQNDKLTVRTLADSIRHVSSGIALCQKALAAGLKAAKTPGGVSLESIKAVIEKASAEHNAKCKADREAKAKVKAENDLLATEIAGERAKILRTGSPIDVARLALTDAEKGVDKALTVYNTLVKQIESAKKALDMARDIETAAAEAYDKLLSVSALAGETVEAVKVVNG